MATYAELADLERDQTLLDKVKSACWVEANVIRLENVATANHANRLIWAAEVYRFPLPWSQRMLRAVLAANESVTQSNILSASDAAILSNVADSVDVFADGTKE